MNIKVGDTVNITSPNSYMLKPQSAVVQSFHTENGWKERHGWVWLLVGDQQLLFWPSEYEIAEEIQSCQV